MSAVSIILPCFNAGATLSACIDSLLIQTHSDFEIIAVDDGSTDESANILREYARRDARVRPLFIEHSGVAMAAMAGIEAARGTYIARMDADDIMLAQRLTLQAKHLDSHPNVGLVGCKVRFGGNRDEAGGYAHYVDWTNTLLTPEAISLNRFVELPVPNPSIMFRRELVDAHGGYLQGGFPEDYELQLRWLERGVVMEKVDAELMVWNDPPTRLTRNNPRYAPDAFYQVKAAYLSRWLAANNANHPAIHILGAGRPTRKHADMLENYNIRIDAYYDLDPKKIGHVISGRPVLHRNQVPPPGEAFLVSYVASRGARADITTFLKSRGYVLGKHWIAAA